MNRFKIESTPEECARSLCDSHVVKMVLEEGQMLSTVHRVVDGKEITGKTKSGRNQKQWVLPDRREKSLYKACHVNHPCTVWARETVGNYKWAFRFFDAVAKEYTWRYERDHKTHDKLNWLLRSPPCNINRSLELTPFPLAMGAAPYCIDEENPIQSYRDYYWSKRDNFDMVWTKREKPSWFKSTKRFRMAELAHSYGQTVEEFTAQVSAYRKENGLT